MQDKAIGVLGAMRAATDPNVHGGQYYGPSGPMQLTGHPVEVRSSDRSHDKAAQRRLWDKSEELTGVYYRALQQT